MRFEAKVLHGKYIQIHQLNDFFIHASLMLLEHFDNEKYKDTLFSVGTYIDIPVCDLRNLFPNKKIIVYQLEQLMSLATWTNIPQIISNLDGADEIWDYDYLNIHYLQQNYNIVVDKFLPLIYSESLNRIHCKENPEIDVLFYGFLNKRRFDIFLDFQRKLYGELSLVWVYGEKDMDKYIANSKIILNLHASEPWNRQEQVRMFYPLINGKTNISEFSQRNNMPDEIIESSPEEMPGIFIDFCRSDKWKVFGEQAKEKFKLRSQSIIENFDNQNIFDWYYK